MNKTRLEAFSDGVIAIIITIMVLEIKVPHGTDWHSLTERWPVMASYIISFIYIGIYWGNHHNMLHTVKQVNSAIIWSNLHLLFWLSLIPLVTEWMGETALATNPMIAYSVVLLVTGVAFTILQYNIEKTNPFGAKMKAAYKKVMKKGIASMTGYAIAIGFAFVNPYISMAFIVAIAILWIVPDRNFERALKTGETD